MMRMSDPSPELENQRADSVRPKLLAVVAVAGFVSSFLWVPLPRGWHIGLGYAVHMALSSLLGMVCMYGFWKMWRWSVYVYAALAVLDALHYCVLRPRAYGPPALEIAFAIVGFMYVRKMQ